MKTAEEILQPYIETPFRHTQVVSKENALKAMQEFSDQYRKFNSDQDCLVSLTQKEVKAVKGTFEALALIAKINGSKGNIKCPNCGNELLWARAENNHVHGKCNTDDCLSWMQ